MDPSGFWQLTPRLFSAHMRGARERVQLDIDMQNRLAWQTACLSGLAFAGKLPEFDKVFPAKGKTQSGPQSPEVQEQMLKVLAAGWGAAATG